MPISLKKAAVWLPSEYEDAHHIALQSGIPEEVVTEKMGIKKKCRAASDIHPSTMAIRAASSVLQDIDPLSVDLVLWTGSEYKDYSVWSAGIYVQQQLGLKNAWSFDLAARCSSNVVGLKVAKSLMLTHEEINRVLVCGGHRTGDLVNYKDPKSRFLYNLADGGSAMLLERGEENPILASSIMTDGEFSLDVIVPGGGTRNRTRDGVALSDTYLTVPKVDEMRERLADRSIENFVKVIKTAAQNSMPRPIDYLALLHMKKSAHDEVLSRLELGQDQSFYMDQYGHFGAPDQVLSLGLAERHHRLKKDDHVVLASAGIGYTWSAIALRWDKPLFVQSTIEDWESSTLKENPL